jgi:hypothetical protein
MHQKEGKPEDSLTSKNMLETENKPVQNVFILIS